MKRYVSIVGVTAMLAAGMSMPVRGQGTVLEQIIVKVNGDILTKTDLEGMQIQALQDAGKSAKTPQDLENDATLKAALDQITPQLLVNAVDLLLIVQRGRELGFRMTDDQFNHFVQQLKADNHITTDDQLIAGLKQQNMTYEQFRERVEQQAIKQQVEQQEIMPRLNLTESEAREYYTTHPQEFQKPATATIREILIAVPIDTRNGQQTVNAGAMDAALAKITAIRARITGGEDFAKVASEVSDAPSKANGGMTGAIDLSQLNPRLKEIISQLKPGEVSDPVQTARGYELYKLESMSAPSLEPFENVREAISDKVYTERVDSEEKKYAEKLRGDALIEWKDEALRKLYDQRLAELAKSGGSD
jgi:peptidyl-prolyl cis-trans isomerase SurA